MALWRGQVMLVEDKGSPQVTYAERVTVRRRFTGPYELCLVSAPLRGAYGAGDMAGYRVSQSTVTHQGKGIGTLEIEYEAVEPPSSQPEGTTPQPEFRVEMERIEVDLREHPRYAELTADERQCVQYALEYPRFSPEWSQAMMCLADANPLARELFEKLLRGQTHYFRWVPVITRVTYHWEITQPLSSGGYLETPPDPGFTLPSGQYLRMADTVRWNGSMWELTEQWIGGPEWDTDIYGAA